MNLSFPQKTILQMLGPSIIFIALSVSGGELLLWPDLIRTYGLTMMIFIPVILLLQFSVNMEIERYTVVTGKNTLRALIQESPWIQFLFPFAITISLMWPAWISTAGNILAVSLGMPEKGIIFSLLLLGGLLTLWQSKRSYSIIEMIAKGGLLCVLFIVGYTLYRLFNANTIYTSFVTGTFIPHGSDALLFISALAYGGVAGVLNLVQSDWVKNKGYAAAGVASPESIKWENIETKKAWGAWWRLIVHEHAWLFLFGNIVGILMLGSLAALTLSGTSAKGFGILAFQVQELNTLAAPLGSLFGIGVCLIFIMAQMAILDASGHLLKHSIEDKTALTHKRLSQGIGLIGMGILAITFFFPKFNQPAVLLQISAALSAAIMAIYPPLLLRINKKLPKEVRPQLRHSLGIWLCSLFYGAVTIWAIYHITL